MTLESLNIHMFMAINSLAGKNPYLDTFMIFSAQYLVYLIPVVILYLWFAKNGDKKFSLFLFLSVFFALIISMGISSVYYHPRPFVEGLGTQLINHAPDSSFPSDHTATMFALALPFLFFRKYKSGSLLTLLAFLVGYARVFCGVHFPFDVIGAFIISLIITILLYAFREPVFSGISRVVDIYERFLQRLGFGNGKNH